MPPLNEGSFVIAKYVESLEDIHDGNTYVLLTRDDGIVYKRVYNDVKKNAALMLHSDNKYYPPYAVKAEDVLELWEYTCAINTNPYKPEELNMDSILSMMRDLKIELERVKK